MNRFLCLVVTLLAVATSDAFAADPFINGVDTNYALDMEKQSHTWSDAGAPDDLFAILARAGVDTIRIRLWTGDEGTNGLAYAIETARRAQKHKIKPILVIFLSENWADLEKQPLPGIWKDLSYDDRLKAVEAYSEEVTRAFAAAGIEVGLFEIGNEIDFGICGEFEGDWAKRVSIDWCRAHLWPRMMPIIKASQAGVCRAKSDAKFIIHFALWNSPEYCVALWKSMLEHGVAIDYAGLSYFPSSAEKKAERTFDHFGKQLDLIRKSIQQPILICETAYPSEPNFTGQFSTWNKPAPNYPLSAEGQAKWLADYLAFLRKQDRVAGSIYWSPEWYASPMWPAFALFDTKGIAKPALRSLK